MSSPQWELIDGRCGACVKFVRDFGGATGKVYGHCGRKPRSGSITSMDFKCDVYAPRPEVAPAAPAEPAAAPRPRARSAIDPFEVTAEALHAQPGGAANKRAVRHRRVERPRAVVMRRQGRQERDQEPVSLSDGGEGDEMDRGTLRDIIREAIEDSLGIGEVDLLDRFQGGNVVIQPGREDTAGKTIPIDQLMRKIVMVRDNLRLLESKINGHAKLDDADRIQLQQYITRCYGSLTTFNVLFQERSDWFRGATTR